MADINRQWLLASRPVGMIGESNFEYRETAIPSPGEGEVLVHNLYLSFDPAQRGWTLDRPSYIPPVQIGEPMRGGAVGQVVESNHADFDVGSFVQGTFGWQDYAVASPTGPMPMTAVPPGVPLTLPLGVLGITGLTAYFGLLDLGEPKEGETVVVSGAAGATGATGSWQTRLGDTTLLFKTRPGSRSVTVTTVPPGRPITTIHALWFGNGL